MRHVGQPHGAPITFQMRDIPERVGYMFLAEACIGGQSAGVLTAAAFVPAAVHSNSEAPTTLCSSCLLTRQQKGL